MQTETTCPWRMDFQLHLRWRQRRWSVVSFLLPLCLACPRFFERLIVISNYPTAHRSTSSILSSVPSIPCGELAFSEWGADSGVHCWITALSRCAAPPQRPQKAASFVWLEVNIWEQMMLAKLIYGFCGDEILLGWGKMDEKKRKNCLWCWSGLRKSKNSCINSERPFFQGMKPKMRKRQWKYKRFIQVVPYDIN